MMAAAARTISKNLARLSNWLDPLEFTLADRQHLRLFGERSADAALRVVRTNRLASIGLRSWADDAQCIAEFLGCSALTSHFLSQPAHAWLKPLERHATEGFAHFLSEGPPDQRRGRVLAVLRALDPPSSRAWPSSLRSCYVLAEQVAPRLGRRGKAGRIDLLISAEGSDGRRVGAIIEAKFEHDIRGNPLDVYEHEAGRHGLDPRNTAFLVIGITQTRAIRTIRQSKPHWRFISWRRFFVRLQAELPPRYDSDEFRRFRATIFQRCH